MIMEPFVALKKRNMCIYLIVYINSYSFTDLSRGLASRGWVRGVFLWIFVFLKGCFITEHAAKMKG